MCKNVKKIIKMLNKTEQLSHDCCDTIYSFPNNIVFEYVLNFIFVKVEVLYNIITIATAHLIIVYITIIYSILYTLLYIL